MLGRSGIVAPIVRQNEGVTRCWLRREALDVGLQLLQLLLGRVKHLVKPVLVHEHVHLRLQAGFQIVHDLGLLPDFFHSPAITFFLLVLLAARTGHLAKITTRCVMSLLIFLPVAPAREEFLVDLCLPHLKLLLALAVIFHLGLEGVCDKLIFFHNFALSLLFVQFFNPRVAFVALNVGDGSVPLQINPLLDDLVLISLLILVLDSHSLILSLLVLSFSGLVEILIHVALLLSFVLLVDDLGLHGLDEAFECVELGLSLQLGQLVHCLLVLAVRERTVESLFDTLLDPGGADGDFVTVLPLAAPRHDNALCHVASTLR